MCDDPVEVDGDIYCCGQAYSTILDARIQPRSNHRHTVVVRRDGELIAWATWWQHLELFHIVLLPGGPDWFRYENLSEFLRIVGDLVEVETTEEMIKLWDGAP